MTRGIVSVHDLQRRLRGLDLGSGSLDGDRDRGRNQKRRDGLADERLEVHRPVVVVGIIENRTAIELGLVLAMLVPAEVGVHGMRGVVIRVVIVGVDVEHEPQEGGDGQGRHQESRDDPPAHA